MSIRYLSGLTVDSTVLVVDAANDRVGIGTASPSYKLDINGVTRFQDIVRLKTGAWNLSDDGFNRLFFGSTTRTYFGSGDGYEWRSAADTALVVLANGGNVGIGTTSPVSKLHIDNALGSDVISISDAAGSVRLALGQESSYTGNYIDSKNIDFKIKSYLAGGSGGNIFFQTGTGTATTKVTINVDGNVGIGTTAPNAKLNVRGTEGSGSVNPQEDLMHVGGNELGGVGGYAGIRIGGASNTSYGAYIRGVKTTAYGNYWNTALTFSVTRTNTETTIDEVMRITSGGNVGIGTTAPGALLQVGQASTDTDALIRLSVSYTGSTPRGGIVWHDTANVTGKIHTEYNGTTMTSMVFGSLYNSGYNSNPLMFIRGDGNVGIGTTAPAAKLEVQGADSSIFQAIFQSRVSTNNGYNGGIQLGNAEANQNSQIYHSSAGDNTLTFVSNYSAGTGNKFIFAPGGTERVRFLQNGNVGIGTTSPANTLQIGSVGATGYSGNRLAVGDGTNVVVLHPGAVSYLTANGDIVVGAGGNTTNQVYVKSGGNVGIGTTAPDQKLHVKRTETVNRTSYTDILTIDADANNSPFSGHGGGILFRGTTYSGGGNNIQGNRIWGRIGMFLNDFYDGFNGESMLFAVAPDDRSDTLTTAMIIQYDGKVGIGTTSPGAPLHVYKSDTYSAIISRADWNSGTSTKLALGKQYGVLGFISSDLVETTNDTSYIALNYKSGLTTYAEGLRVYNNGNVGIGTTSPASLVHIDRSSSSNNITGTPSIIISNQNSTSGTFIGGGIFNNPYRDVSSSSITAGVWFENQNSTDAGALAKQSAIIFGAQSYSTGYNTPSERMRITAAGNVGIGTTAPGSKLNVVDGFIRVQGTETDQFFLEGLRTGTSTTVRIYDNSSTVFYDSYSNMIFRANQLGGSGGYIGLFGGNVGINTASPGYKLEVTGSGKFSNGHSGTLTVKHNYSYQQPNWGIKLDGDTSTSGGYLSQYINIGGFELAQGGTYYGGGPWRTDANSTSFSAVSGYDGIITFSTDSGLTANSSFTPSERMRITAAGNVGIGTTSPSTKLQVSGSTSFYNGAAATGAIDSGQSETITTGFNLGPSESLDISTISLTSNTTWKAIVSGEYANNLEGGGLTSSSLEIELDSDFPTIDVGSTDITFSRNSVTGKLQVTNTNGTYRVTFVGSIRVLNYPQSGKPNVSKIMLKNVGIGTTAPASKLDVYGDARFGDGNNFNPLIQFAGSGRVAASPGYSFVGDLDTGMFNPNLGNTLAFTTAGSERLRIDSAGSVGIGTTAPVSILHIEQIQNAESLITLRNNRQDAGNVPIFGISAQNSTTDVAKISFYRGTGGLSGYLTFSTKFDNASSLTERVRIDGSGNVGIGTTSPGYKLHVSGNVYINETLFVNQLTTIEDGLIVYDNLGIGTTSPVSKLNINNGDAWINVTDTLRGLQFGFAGPSHGSYRAAVMGGAESYGGTDSGVLTFHTQNGYVVSAIPPERMRITSVGNVGIGTTSPAEKLHVVGIGRFDGVNVNVRAIDGTIITKIQSQTVGGTQGAVGTESNNDLAVVTNNTTRMLVTAAGNVGIGTTAPLTKLSVHKTTAFSTSSNQTGEDNIFLTSATAAGSGVFGASIGFSRNGFHDRRAAAIASVQGTADEDQIGLAFFTHPTIGGADAIAEAMRISYDGNVGIGTTAPDSPLEIYRSQARTSMTGTAFGTLHIDGGETSGYISSITLAQYANVPISIIGTKTDTSAGTTMFFGTSNSYVSGVTNTAMVIRYDGNVGIGTTNPDAKLHVAGNIRLGIGGSNDKLDILHGAGSGDYGAIRFYAAGTEINTIHSFPAAWQGGTIYTASANALNFSLNSTFGVWYQPDVVFPSGGSAYFRNNVGIGTTAPSTVLHLSSASPELSFTATGLNRTSFVGMPDGANFYIKNTTAGNLYISDYNSVYIAYGANSQNVGIGTTGPTEKLHVDGSTLITYNNSFQSTNSVGNKAILARVSPTSGIVNYAEYATATNLNGFVIGSDDARVKGNIATDSLEFITNTSTRMTVLSSGNVGINTTVPGSTLHVVGDVLIQTGALGVGVNPNATDGRIDASNDIVAFSTSDRRLKENIIPIANALEKVKSLTGVEFDWKEETKKAHGHSGRDTGVIAQEVQAIMPTAVRTNNTGYLAVRYEKLIGLLIEGMKEQQAQIDELKAQINDSSR